MRKWWKKKKKKKKKKKFDKTIKGIQAHAGQQDEEQPRSARLQLIRAEGQERARSR